MEFAIPTIDLDISLFCGYDFLISSSLVIFFAPACLAWLSIVAFSLSVSTGPRSVTTPPIVTILTFLADAASSSELKEAFTAHLTETEGHVARLKEILEALGEEPSGETCKAMEGLIKEGEDYVKAAGDKQVRDAGLIGAAQRVEHYEMAGYGTARTLATRLGESEAADSLQATLDEEEDADLKLTEIAESEVNPAASHRSVS